MLGNGQRRRQARRADAADGQVALIRMGSDAVVGVLGCGPEPGVDGGDLVVDEGGQDPASVRQEGVDACPGGRGVRAVLEVLGGRPEQDVAEDGRGDEHALGRGRWDRQQHVVDQATGQLVEDEQLTPAGRDGEVLVTERPVEVVGAQPGGVDDHPGLDGPVGRGQDGRLGAYVDPGHLRLQQ